MNILTLTTDFGRDSSYVAQMKGVLLSLCNQPPLIVDVSHSVPPQDVFAGAFLLEDVCHRFPPGTLHLAVVDPGVGTSRKIVYAELGEQKFIGPDNGLLSLTASLLGIRRIISLENKELWLKDRSATFHGRDIMTPVAAAVLNGTDPIQFGPLLERLVEIPSPKVESLRDGSLRGEVIHVDSFGNLITNISESDLRDDEYEILPATVRIADVVIEGLSKTYGQSPPGSLIALIALIGSGGRLEIAVVNGNAAERLKVGRGETVEVRL